jgi:hypothetical protein
LDVNLLYSIVSYRLVFHSPLQTISYLLLHTLFINPFRTKCETRHQTVRSTAELGNQRPLTGWSDSGNTIMPSFAWNQWANAQVHRIHDLMDINTLLMAQVGMDCTYKTMVWNLSQNVDRDTMGKVCLPMLKCALLSYIQVSRVLHFLLQLGLCQCLTPSGVPYVTNRGGPLVGEELLLLVCHERFCVALFLCQIGVWCCARK